MKVYGAGLLSSAAELQYVMNGVEVSAVDISMLKHDMSCFQTGHLPLLELKTDAVFSAEMMVTTYQKQYFYTETMENAKEFVRDIANDIKRPFSVR